MSVHVTDVEFRESADNRELIYQTELGRAPVEATHVEERTFMDRLGRGRWPIDYYTARLNGLSHALAMQRERWEIRNAANLPQPEPKPEYPVVAPPTPVPPPAGGLIVGPGNFRAPDPAPNTVLPLPSYGRSVVESVARAFPHHLANSCQDHPGGTWEFMDWAVDTLRTHDLRWGYNGKRGNTFDPSKDAVAYHRGRGPEQVAGQGATEVYIIDIVGGHCGNTPQASWSDVTDITLAAGTIGRWVTRGRF